MGAEVFSCCQKHVGFIRTPAIAHAEIQRLERAFAMYFRKRVLMSARENRDRAEITAEGMEGPLILLEVMDRDARIVLHDALRLPEHEVAYLREAAAMR